MTPQIETERLSLRAHRLDDYSAMLAMWSHAETTRYLGGMSFGPEQVWQRLLRYCGHWQLLGFGYWALEEKTSKKFIGEIGFAEGRRQMTPSMIGYPEIGWALHPDYHGKGYATEGLGKVIDWGKAHLKEKRTFCLISPENSPSLRAAAKINYQEKLRAEYGGHPTVLLERLLTP